MAVRQASLCSQALPMREQSFFVLQAMESWAGPGNEARAKLVTVKVVKTV